MHQAWFKTYLVYKPYIQIHCRVYYLVSYRVIFAKAIRNFWADDQFVILFVKKGYGLVSARSQPYHTRPERGPAPVVVWSNALPQTASYLSPLVGFESRPGHVNKLPVTWVRRSFSPGSPVASAAYNWLPKDLTAVRQKRCRKIEIPNTCPREISNVVFHCSIELT